MTGSALLLIATIGLAGDLDERQIRQEGKATLSWRSAVGILVILGLNLLGAVILLTEIPKRFL